MSHPIILTPSPVYLTQTGAQELRLAVDVMRFKELELVLRVLYLNAGAGPTITVRIETGMQIASEDGWVQVADFTTQTSAPATEKKNFDGLLRYVRYNVTSLADSATIYIQGVGIPALGDEYSQELYDGASMLDYPVGEELVVSEPTRRYRAPR